MQRKIDAHKRFWAGEGPSLILIPPERQELYDTQDYPALFHDPAAMWRSEVARAQPSVDWPTDGIPTVRPNLGVIFVPAMAGMGFSLRKGQMPWPGKHLDREQIRAARNIDIADTELMNLADRFYAIHREGGIDTIAAYHADTQGVFDVAHLLYGSELLYIMADDSEAGWVDELMAISLGLCVNATIHLKKLLDEDAGSMIHGHGTSQGVYFTDAGIRVCEDTATLLSPAMIDRFILPAVEKVTEPFGGAFLHFCGGHDALLEKLCRIESVRALDLGNPEMYDTARVLGICAETSTVLYSHISAEDGETWDVYVRRIARLVRETGARCILRPAVFPDSRDDCAAMRDLWHELTECG